MANIVGGVTSINNPRTNWAQTDAKKADFLKNKPSVANALKGNKSGEVVSIDDVSPIERNLNVKISGVENVGDVKVLKQGKNFFDVSKVITFKNPELYGDRWVVNNGDGSITISTGSLTSTNASSPRTLRNYAPNLKVGQSYKLSADSTGKNKYIYLTKCKESWMFGNTKTITEDMLNSDVLWYASGMETTATISNIQIELSDPSIPATEYEPYIEPVEYTVNADGSVDGIDSIYPLTNLLTDTDGAVIECEYNRDANKVITDLENKLNTLIATIGGE